MTARTPEPCDVPRGVHEGPVRFYLTGWKCGAHAPEPEPREPQLTADHTT